jgi:prepilin-type N-terminal cleavage/methylation domain-containing protein
VLGTLIMLTATQRDRGLTIIEVMAVLLVLGVLITLVAPSMRGMIQRQHVQGVHDQIVTDLQLARSELAARPTSIAVQFGGNASITCYTIHTVDAGAACDCTRTPGQASRPRPGDQDRAGAQSTGRVAGRVEPERDHRDLCAAAGRCDARRSGRQRSG